jgi:hypothetical protein
VSVSQEARALERGATCGLPAAITSGGIDPGEERIHVFSNPLVRLLQFILDWPGSKLRLTITRPDGSTYGSYETRDPPIDVTIDDAEPGDWTLAVDGIEVPQDNYLYSLVVAAGDACAAEGCDDAEPCTVDACSPVGGCTHRRIVGCGVPPTTTSTTSPATSSTTTLPPACPSCDDDDPCSDDRCDPGSGCAHEVVSGDRALTCAFDRALTIPECAGQRVPPKIGKQYDKARRRVGQALGAPSMQRRIVLLRKAVALLDRARRAALRAGQRRKRPLSSDCAEGLVAIVTAASERVATPAASAGR